MEGRLEMVNGGWVSPDETCPSYIDTILNMKVGNEFLQREFGI